MIYADKIFGLYIEIQFWSRNQAKFAEVNMTEVLLIFPEIYKVINQKKQPPTIPLDLLNK